MSNLPTVDPLKAAQRHNQKLSSQLVESQFRETNLEVLAEALRDERDAARSELSKAQSELEKLKGDQ